MSRYELSQYITFDRLTYKGSYINDRRMTKEDLSNSLDSAKNSFRHTTHNRIHA